MGEEPWRVRVSGEPNVDAFCSMQLLSQTDLEQKYGLRLRHPFLLVTYHPVTRQYEETEGQIEQLLEALQAFGFPVVFTMPNADVSNQPIRERIRDFVAHNPA